MKKLLGFSYLRSILLVCSLLLIVSGCVSKARHQELLDSYQSIAQQKSDIEQSCEERTEQLSGQIDEFTQINMELATKAEEQASEKLAEAEAMQEMVFLLEEKLIGEETRVSQLENSMQIEVLDKLMFESGSAVVSREGSMILAKIAPTLISAIDQDIIIIGHTDDLPPSSDLASKYPSNWELSAARAASIAHILTWNYLIPPSRMMIQGAAHYHPLMDFDVEDNSTRQTNRAVEIILKAREE